MDHLNDISMADLQEALDAVDQKKPTLRLVAAIAYKNGVSQSDIAAWFGVERKTIYNWLTRFEGRDPKGAALDKHRPGRPRKLTASQLDTLLTTLHNPPVEAGYNADAWTTSLVEQLLRDMFDVEYSRSSCRRLMKEAGLTPRYGGAADAGHTETPQSDHEPTWMLAETDASK